MTFIKRNSDAPAGFFEAEAAGLAWLAEADGGVATAAVIRVAPGIIELEEVAEALPSEQAADAFGAGLARTHAAGAAAFGSPPHGYAGPTFIGRRPLTTARQTRWGRFYARDRVLPYLAAAVEAGTVLEAEARVIREACDRIADGDFDDSEPPARLHGDLWNGNVLWSATADGSGQVVLIDPAAHGGHRETDLAMLALFGCPHLERVLAAYDRESPLREGWRDRVPVHQLHPLAVHAAGHGRSYGIALTEAAEATLRL